MNENLKNRIKQLIKENPNYNYYSLEWALKVIDELYDDFTNNVIIYLSERVLNESFFVFKFNLSYDIFMIMCFEHTCQYIISNKNTKIYNTGLVFPKRLYVN